MAGDGPQRGDAWFVAEGLTVPPLFTEKAQLTLTESGITVGSLTSLVLVVTIYDIVQVSRCCL